MGFNILKKQNTRKVISPKVPYYRYFLKTVKNVRYINIRIYNTIDAFKIKLLRLIEYNLLNE